MANSNSWQLIFNHCQLNNFDFKNNYFILDAKHIKQACHNLKTTTEKEVRILCKQDTRESRPQIFQDRNLFLLPIKNGKYAIIHGEGYCDIPEINTQIIPHKPMINFDLIGGHTGDSEMQHLDYAYATSVIRTFTNNPHLVLSIRGRKYTPEFNFNINGFQINQGSVQTEVDGGYEGPEDIVLVEAKPAKIKNIIIRQLYYPFRQWVENARIFGKHKNVSNLLFQKNNNIYSLWQFQFTDQMNYNSIKLIKSARYEIIR